MGRDKATMPHPRRVETTMLEYTVSVVHARCAPTFVVAAPGQPLPELADATILRDEARGIGPLLATGRGLRAAAAAGAQRAFVCAVDMPNLTADIVDALDGRDGVDIALAWDGRDHYLAGIYRTALADRIDELVASGERSMRALTECVLTQRIVIESGDALVNLNSRDWRV